MDQIQEFIQQYHGEGIQHVALRTDDLFRTWDELKARGLKFMTAPPDSYYEMLEERLPGHGQSVAICRSAASCSTAPMADTGADLHSNPDRPHLFRNHRAQGR